MIRRPELHFTPEKGWMNDPNGLVFDGTFYHLFYQFYPDGLEPRFECMHWGHARSRDLLRWEHLPIALFPDAGSCYSGSAVMDGERMVLLYTCHAANGEESQCIARSLDREHTRFERDARNPVIPNPGLKDFRDPKLFLRDDQGWHALIAAGDKAMFYRSADLSKWTLEGEFGAPLFPARGMWECPDLFPLTTSEGETRWVLVVSLGLDRTIGGGRTMYWVGDYESGNFTPIDPTPLPVDSGQDFYAGVTFWGTPDERRIMVGWMNNWAYADRREASGWRGQMSLPRVLSLIKLREGFRLAAHPIVDESRVKRIAFAGQSDALMVRDHHLMEVFVPDCGFALAQAMWE